jgi:hypothetical protein
MKGKVLRNFLLEFDDMVDLDSLNSRVASFFPLMSSLFLFPVEKADFAKYFA